MTTTARTDEWREHRRLINRRWAHARGVRRRPPRPLTLHPLLAAITDRPDIMGVTGQDRSAAENRTLGMTRGERSRWLRSGLDVYTFDRLATHAGIHPAEILGAAWWTDLIDDDEVAS